MAKIKQKIDSPPAPQDEKPADIQNDEHRGMGGSYVFDPDTGKRTRVAGPELDKKTMTDAESAESAESTETEIVNNESQ